jgi:hypothetical protein
MKGQSSPKVFVYASSAEKRLYTGPSIKNPKELRFEVKPFEIDNLFRSLSNDHFNLHEVSEHPQARYLFQYLDHKELNATIILVEYDYTDKDYLDDYASYHVKCFKEYRRTCKRIHFFSAVGEDKKHLDASKFTKVLINAIKGVPQDASDLQDWYLGFVVARPLPIAIFGRTLLKTFNDMSTKRRKFCKNIKSKVNLFGVDLHVDSLGFMEQDQTLAACATIALWTCFQKCGDLFKTPVLSPTEITSLANETVQKSRIVPSDGLTVEQVACAIHKNKLEAEIFDVVENTYLKSVLYAYLHYKIPVLLTLDMGYRNDYHAVAITGFSLDENDQKSLKPELGRGDLNPIPFKSTRIDRFYAHDDNVGPYARFEIRNTYAPYSSAYGRKKEWKNFIKTRRGKEESPFSLWRTPTKTKGLKIVPDNGEPLEETEDLKPMRFVPDVVIVPLYHKIRVNVQDVQTWIMILSKLIKLNNMLDKIPVKKLEWDVYLTDQKELKKDIRGLNINTVGLHEYLSVQRHPRFIWRSTLLYNNTYLMDLLTDATDIGGETKPFYDVIFYNEPLGQKFSKMFTRERYEKGVLWMTRQLDSFFYEYFIEKERRAAQELEKPNLWL